MKQVELVRKQHSVKVGDSCGDIVANVTEDCILSVDGKQIGFYLKTAPPKMCELASLANAEFNSARVPKSLMRRSAPAGSKPVEQYSATLGAVAPRPHMRRPYATTSSLHQVKSAKNFVKAMLLLAKEASLLIRDLTPSVFEEHKACFSDVPEKWRFGELWTSAICNYNISAPFHRDGGNIEGCVNVIVVKKENALGGNTTVPDYDITVDSCDNSVLVYPAWRNVHGVTPIRPTENGGYRNSFILYPLKAFKMLED